MTSQSGTPVRLHELLGAVSLTTDLAMGQPMAHGQRTAYLAVELADAAGLSREDRTAAYYGSLLKDVG